MNTSAARESFDDLEGMLRMAVEQIASAPPPVEVAERVLGRAAKWEGGTVSTVDKSKRQDPHPGPLPKGEGVRRRLYLAAVAALALVVLVAVAIAIVGGLPKEKTIAVPPQVKKTEPENNTEPENKKEPKENPPNAAAAGSPASGLGGVTPPADNSPDMRLGMQPRTGFGGSGGFGAGGGVPSKRGGAIAAKEEQASKIDQERMVGTWAIVNEESKRTAEMWAISEDRILMYANYSGMTSIWHFHRLDAGKDPKQIDITVTKVNGSPSSPIGIIKGIYALDGDELRLCLAEMGKDRPAKFPEKSGPDEFLILRRGRLGGSPPKGGAAPDKQEPPATEKPAAEKPIEKPVENPAEKPAQPEASAEAPKGKGGPPAYREAFAKAKQDEPKNAVKESEVLTHDEAIKLRGQEKVTVQFKVASVKMGWSSGRIPKGAKTSQSWFQLDDGNNFSVVLKGGPTYRLEQLGIDARRHFEGKVVRATGRVLGEEPPFSIGVDDLDQFEVVLQPYVKGEPAAPQKDPPSGTKLEKKVLTPEEAIMQRPKEQVTVQFKIAEVHAAPSPGTGFGSDVILLKDGGKFSARIGEPARAMILHVGIEPEKHFLGKVIWVTGLVEPVPGTGAESSFHILVKDLTQLNVVREQQPAPPADPKESRKKPAKNEKLLALIDQILTAHGGEEKWSKLQFTMTVKVDNGTTDKYFVQPPKNFRWESVHENSPKKRICILLPQGRQFWIQEPGEPAKPIHYFGAELPMAYHLDRVKFFGPREVLRLK